ncbi:MAG: DNA replication/repair protein RecF [Proteobacteria bacterium]|nr:DNA replication/repair protein RecF [Pseudomonadota bacterium]
MAKISRLSLTGLRNLAPVALDTDSKNILITGSNGAGKTALLEGISLLATGRSFRESRLQRCQQWQATQLTLYAEVDNCQGQHKLGWQRYKQNTQLRLNGEQITSQAQLARQLPIQVFSPESHDLLTHGPNERRRFLDWGAFYQEASFLPAWRRYQHALKQRNHALKQQRPDNEIALWNAPLWDAALQIHQTRSEYTTLLAETATPLLAQVSDSLQNIQLSYQAGWPEHETTLITLWHQQLAHDRQLGYTQAGPHRADLKLRIEDRDALSLLSRGQQKLLALTLMLAQAQLLRNAIQETPILLLDDLAAELDAQHQARVLTLLPSLNTQTFLTATNEDSLKLLSTQRQHWHLEQGNIRIIQ